MKRRHISAAIGLALGLSACASVHDVEPGVRLVEAPVPVPCRPELGPEPQAPDTDEALRSASDLFERVRLLAAGRLLRIARERELRAALEACGG